METIKVPLDLLKKNGLTINEYILLYDIINQYQYSDLIDNAISTLFSLQKKGFIKLQGTKDIILRSKAVELFELNEDYFEKWLKTYPTMVKKRYGGKRALSPAKSDTILGKALRVKWKNLFKKDIESQKKAIEVLEAQIRDATRSGDLEYMVEARRWLNEGYHEKYSFLIEENNNDDISYESEDYM